MPPNENRKLLNEEAIKKSKYFEKTTIYCVPTFRNITPLYQSFGLPLDRTNIDVIGVFFFCETSYQKLSIYLCACKPSIWGTPTSWYKIYGLVQNNLTIL